MAIIVLRVSSYMQLGISDAKHTPKPSSSFYLVASTMVVFVNFTQYFYLGISNWEVVFRVKEVI